MLEERPRRTLVLLDSYFSYLPHPYKSALPASSGPAPSRTARCNACQGTGKAGKHVCHVCDGLGRRKRLKGEASTDEYTGDPVGTSDTRPSEIRAMTPQELDAAIHRIERDVASREGTEIPGDDLQMVTQKQSLRRHGDYEALGWALLWLREEHPQLFFHAWQGIVLGWDVPHPDHHARAREAVALLAERMPDPIRVPAWLDAPHQARSRSLRHGRTANHGLQRAQRNGKIRELRALGHSTTRLAIEFQISRRMVQHLLRTDHPS